MRRLLSAKRSKIRSGQCLTATALKYPAKPVWARLTIGLLQKLPANRVRIGFNDRYMMDALKASGEDEVRLELGSTLSPIKIMPLEGDAFTFLVMPMRLKDDR